MPWKEVKPMDQKVQLVADWHTRLFSITDLSHKYGIHRKTIYKWIGRYDEHGVCGLEELSRAPKSHPQQTPDTVIDRIIAQRNKNRKRGPKKIRAVLRREYPHIEWPAASTIGDLLKKRGLVLARKKRRSVPPDEKPFADCQSPNNVWSADYKGQFYTRNKRVCYPLTISDNYSRYLLACTGLPGPRYRETRAVFESVFREYGVPDAMRTDNGTPFVGTGIGGLSQLLIWWIRLGIMPERIDKGCPSQNGRHERMHRTLKADALDPIAATMKEQQKQFDLFRIEYNHYRPHEVWNQQPPATQYTRSTRPYMEKPPVPQYDYEFKVRYVRHNGEIKFNGNLYYLTALLTGEPVGLKALSDDLWQIYYGFYPLGFLDIQKNKILRTGQKVLPMSPV
jgi:putative transposase